MSYHVIGFMASQREVITFEHPDKFYFRKDRKWHWLQKLCFKLLKKIGAFASGYEEKIHTISFSTDNMIDYIAKQQHTLFRHYGIDEIDYILMGPEEFREIMRLATFDMRMQFGFNVNVPYTQTDGTYYHKELMGMKIRVVPTVKGVAVIPHDQGFIPYGE